MTILSLWLSAFALTMFTSVLVWVIALAGIVALAQRKWKVAAWIAGALVVIFASQALWLVAAVGIVAFVLRQRDIAAVSAGLFIGQLLAPFAGTPSGHTLFVVCLGVLVLNVVNAMLQKKPAPLHA